MQIHDNSVEIFSNVFAQFHADIPKGYKDNSDKADGTVTQVFHNLLLLAVRRQQLTLSSDEKLCFVSSQMQTRPNTITQGYETRNLTSPVKVTSTFCGILVYEEDEVSVDHGRWVGLEERFYDDWLDQEPRFSITYRNGANNREAPEVRYTIPQLQRAVKDVITYIDDGTYPDTTTMIEVVGSNTRSEYLVPAQHVPRGFLARWLSK
jgi:hypothetical protein